LEKLLGGLDSSWFLSWEEVYTSLDVTAHHFPGVRQALYGQGICMQQVDDIDWHFVVARHSRQEIAQMAIDDLNAISTFLGDKQYLLGSKITTVDASLWGENLKVELWRVTLC
jgi:hypothetical protein